MTEAGGAPLGGVTVTVQGGAYTGATKTLTGGLVGSYVLTGIPTPGSYSVTFSLDGYGPETRLVSFAGPGTVAGTDVVLHPATATISGTASVGGTPSAAVQVILCSGGAPRTTTTATSPAGSYSFTAVAPGSYTLTFTFPGDVTPTDCTRSATPGHATQIVLVQVAAGDVLTKNVNVP